MPRRFELAHLDPCNGVFILHPGESIIKFGQEAEGFITIQTEDGRIVLYPVRWQKVDDPFELYRPSCSPDDSQEAYALK